MSLRYGRQGANPRKSMSVRKVVKKAKKHKAFKTLGGFEIKPRAKRPDVVERSKGNDWWNLRSKHGRAKLFVTPELMWEAACEYFQHCLDNPDERGEIVKYEGSASVETIETRRAFTWERLCLYLDCSTAYFRVFRNTTTDKGFLTVIEKIDDTIRSQQYEGVLSGHYPGQIVSQYIGLVSRTDVTTKDEKVSTVAPAINIYNTAPPFALGENEIDKEIKDEKD